MLFVVVNFYFNSVLLVLTPVASCGFSSDGVKFSGEVKLSDSFKTFKKAAAFSVLCCSFLSFVKSTAPSGFEPPVCSIF
ncbi:MAG: hypothetical protein HC942_24090 [Microcoleus sp. SU_5_6]|nr:hypothetical protein [Microcoleus sp. SU_5_6]